MNTTSDLTSKTRLMDTFGIKPQDDVTSWFLIPLLGLMVAQSMLAGIVHGLTSDERWAQRFHQPERRTGWLGRLFGKKAVTENVQTATADADAASSKRPASAFDQIVFRRKQTAAAVLQRSAQGPGETSANPAATPTASGTAAPAADPYKPLRDRSATLLSAQLTKKVDGRLRSGAVGLAAAAVPAHAADFTMKIGFATMNDIQHQWGTWMKEAVEECGGEGAVVIEDGWPLLVCAVRSNDGGSPFVALADDLKEEVSAMFVDGEVAQFIKDEQ